ncbi:MAG TPA: universal stress protein [Solirubrobacteraceae bacterium]|nr:universal stress protein [Solirubrobacteraceae bacterium]
MTAAPPAPVDRSLYTRAVVLGAGGNGGRDARALAVRLAAPGAEILSCASDDPRLAAARTDADLIVLARKGDRSAAGTAPRDILSLLHGCAQPVAVAPPGYAARAAPISRIAVAVDGGPDSLIAARHAAALRDEVHGTLVPVCVVNPLVALAPWGGTPVVEADPRPLSPQTAEQLHALGAGPLRILRGLTGAELCEFAAGVDLLVCGSRRRDALHRVVLGSTSEYLVRHLAFPLLITPAAGP